MDVFYIVMVGLCMVNAVVDTLVGPPNFPAGIAWAVATIAYATLWSKE